MSQSQETITNKQLRQWVTLSRAIHRSGLIPDFDQKNITELVGFIELNHPAGEEVKSQWPRHGAKWEEDEISELITHYKAGAFDLNAFAARYQRKPGSVRIKMINLQLIDEETPL